MNIRLFIVLLLLNTSVFAQLHTYKWTNGNKKAEGVVKDGLEQGKWTFWSKEGVIQQEVTYKDGEFHGEYINYNDEGKKVEQGNFVHSMKEGECKVWYENGQLELVGYNKIGYRDSLWTFYYPSGNKKEEGHFKRDERAGEWTSWYDNKQIKSKMLFDNGVAKMISFWSNDGKGLVVNGLSLIHI